jgi:hypothetical protein
MLLLVTTVATAAAVAGVLQRLIRKFTQGLLEAWLLTAAAVALHNSCPDQHPTAIMFVCYSVRLLVCALLCDVLQRGTPAVLC